ncbi:unnamed protein product [Pleuronectes platessa]|uniref:Uncharacterized protein n=1 Tax=Pleuronectes platessa TaxID=8262 RepID=A0A9N7UQ83_PLEPL|nr:unnamed protein product [Pleuronectes platessa]
MKEEQETAELLSYFKRRSKSVRGCLYVELQNRKRTNTPKMRRGIECIKPLRSHGGVHSEREDGEMAEDGVIFTSCVHALMSRTDTNTGTELRRVLSVDVVDLGNLATHANDRPGAWGRCGDVTSELHTKTQLKHQLNGGEDYSRGLVSV